MIFNKKEMKDQAITATQLPSYCRKGAGKTANAAINHAKRLGSRCIDRGHLRQMLPISYRHEIFLASWIDSFLYGYIFKILLPKVAIRLFIR